MKTIACFSSLFILLVSAASVGCSNAGGDADASASEDETAVDESEVRAKKECSPETYEKAFTSYRSAVERSKRHLAEGVCAAEDAYTHTIIEELATSVSTCHQFRDVIKNSPWAKPVREVLANNLALPALTGALKDDLSNLATALPGVSVWGPGGTLGPTSTIHFGANGKATEERVEWSEQTNAPKRISHAATWRVQGGVIVITIGANEQTFEVERSPHVKPIVPAFEIKPVPPMAEDAPTYSTTPSECDA